MFSSFRLSQPAVVASGQPNGILVEVRVRKFTAAACVALGLTVVPGVASAAPIGPVGCVDGLCDISIDAVTGYTLLDANLPDFSPDWLVGYTFLLNSGANVADGINAAEVAQALVFHSGSIELFTPLHSSFETVVSDALSGAPIDTTLLWAGQIVGEPIAVGSRRFNIDCGSEAPAGVICGVGLFDTAPTVDMLNQIAYGDGEAGIGGYDSLTVHTVGPTQPVPEPGSLSLLALGGASVFASAFRRRRARKTA